MSSTPSWSEFNGSNGATETPNRTDCYWKSIDDSVSDYQLYPVTATENSFLKLQGVVFSGSWAELSALTYMVSNNIPGPGMEIVGSVVAAAQTPSTLPTGDGLASMTGVKANFVSSTTPYGAGSPTTTAGGKMYAQLFRTQLQTTIAAYPGPTIPIYLIADWIEQ